MIKQRLFFHFAETQVAYTLFRSKNYDASCNSPSSEEAPRRIMLLHGAGVAGELTWTFIVNYLKHWDEVLVPDLLGMGESFFESSDQLAFSIEDICQQSLPDTTIKALCLIEPALFSDQSLQAALSFRQSFVPLAVNIKLEPDNDQHFLDFLDLVSPNRKRSSQIDKLAVERLQLRPLGFAHALAAVSDYADNLDEFKLQQLLAHIPKGLGIVGGLSNPGLLLAQQKIQHQLQSYPSSQNKYWHIESLDNADHSLVYVRPKIVAGLINEYLG